MARARRKQACSSATACATGVGLMVHQTPARNAECRHTTRRLYPMVAIVHMFG